jgi:hypothetical protein
MAARTQLDARSTIDVLGLAARVLADHRAALDRLELGDAWDGEDLDGPSLDVAGDDVATASGAPMSVTVPAGTDLCATLDAVVARLDGCSSFAQVASTLDPLLPEVAGGAAGRGVAAVVSGLVEAARNADTIDAGRFAIGLELGAEQLAATDDGGHPGGLPAVLGRAADAALGAVDAGADLADVVIAAADDGLAELEEGPRSNPELVERGVVDAGAAGVLLLLDVVASAVTGEPLPEPPVEAPSPTGSGERYVVRCRVEPHDGVGIESPAWLESTWHELGELVQFDPQGDRWRVELHTLLPGAAVEALHEVGRPRELHIAVAHDRD